MKKKFIVFVIAFVLYIAFTIIVKNVNVAGNLELGTYGKVGLSGLNFAILKAIGVPNERYAAYANALVIVACMPIAIMALVGLGQIIKNGHFFKADPIMYGVAVMGVTMIGIYFVFDKAIIINYRPYLDKPSYPSSHVVLGTFSLSCSWYFFRRYLPQKINWLQWVALAICILFIGAIATCKILCAEHYLTDVIGSLFLNFFLMSGAIFFEQWFSNVFDKTIYKGKAKYHQNDIEE